MRSPKGLLLISLLIFGLGAATWAWFTERSAASSGGIPPAAPVQASPVFTTAHRNLASAFKEFFGWRPAPVQPIAFTHVPHLEKGIRCTACHAGVDQGPVAGLPSVKVCMICHSSIAVDQPEIQKVTSYYKRGEEIPWQRVYGFTPSAHVKFNHAPHIRASVNCSACHGDVTKQTVAVRAVDLTMGYCIRCHRANSVSVDCVTCHY